MKLAEFEALSDSFSWSRYFAVFATPPMDTLNVIAPRLFQGQETLLKSIRWMCGVLSDAPSDPQPVDAAAKKFDDENFGFYGKFLTGAKSRSPAGSDASRPPMAIWARRSQGVCSRQRSAPKASSARSTWW